MHCLQTEFKFCACTVFKNHLIVYFRTYIQKNPYFNISFCLIFSKNLFIDPLCHFFRPWINLLLQKWMMTFYLLLLIWKKTRQMKIKIQVINLKNCKISTKNTYLKRSISYLQLFCSFKNVCNCFKSLCTAEITSVNSLFKDDSSFIHQIIF